LGASVYAQSEIYKKVIVDTENYREKRKQTLSNLANRLAKKVYRTGKSHTFEPMNPYERRIIHYSLQKNPYVETYSIGEEPNRRVVIKVKEH
jgi:spoIIIJ-associated protein